MRRMFNSFLFWDVSISKWTNRPAYMNMICLAEDSQDWWISWTNMGCVFSSTNYQHLLYSQLVRRNRCSLNSEWAPRVLYRSPNKKVSPCEISFVFLLSTVVLISAPCKFATTISNWTILEQPPMRHRAVLRTVAQRKSMQPMKIGAKPSPWALTSLSEI